MLVPAVLSARGRIRTEGALIHRFIERSSLEANTLRTLLELQIFIFDASGRIHAASDAGSINGRTHLHRLLAIRQRVFVGGYSD
jgi:hypothetical protein